MTPDAYALLGLTAIVGAIAAALMFSVLRFTAAARNQKRSHRSHDEVALLSSALHDAVTRLKAQERATAARAQATERLSGEIIASLSAGLLVVTLDGRVQILNPAARRMLGLDEHAATDDYRRLLAAPPLSALIDECLRTGAAVQRRTVHLTEGTHDATHLGVTVSPLTNEHGEPHGAVCLFGDLTAVVQLEEQLRLKESLATVGELTAGIAHEFRNGLATILGYSKLVNLEQLPESYRPYLEGIRAETQSLGQIVTNFLNFARPAQLTLSRVDLRAICERAADEVRPDARALGGDLVVRGEFTVIDGDDVLLRQAISNLLRNAIQACASVPVRPAIVVESSVDHEQKLAKITVDDNGPGIAPEARVHVFRPFFSSRRDGTGLGLALVQKIIVFHNGRIHVGTSPAGGASLQITLPVHD